MIVDMYSGALKEIIDAIEAGGSQIRRIFVTPEEMEEIQTSNTWRETISKYYGDAKAVMDNIVTDRNQKFLSFTYKHILVAVQPPVVALPRDTTVYEPLEIEERASTTFVKGTPAAPRMLVGTGNPAHDFKYGSNENIELGIALRRRLGRATDFFGDPDDAGNYKVVLTEAQTWVFAVTVGSLHPEFTNVCDMYKVELHLGRGDGTFMVWDLKRVNQMHNGVLLDNYVWCDGPTFVITDGSTDAEKRCIQTIQRYEFPFISPFMPENAPRNSVGSYLGVFDFKLVATPLKRGLDPVEVTTKLTVTAA